MCKRLAAVALVTTLIVFQVADSSDAQQRLLGEGVKELAAEIAASATKVDKRRIAIVPFRELDGAKTLLGTYLVEALTTSLFRVGGVEIVERAMLDKVLAELKLGESAAIDSDTAKKVGKIAGVDAIVTGTITDLATFVAVNCRMIDAETGRVFAAAETSVFKDDNLKKIMGLALDSRDAVPAKSISASVPQSPAATIGSSSTLEPASPPARPVSMRATMNGLVFELEACRWSDAVVNCTLSIRNDLSQRSLRIAAGFNNAGTRAYGEGGREYWAYRVQLGTRAGFSGGIWALSIATYQLPNGVPVRAIVSFKDVPATIREFGGLEIACSMGGREGDFTVDFRNVAVVQ